MAEVPREVDLLMASCLKELELGFVVQEHRFDVKRRWRFDWAVPGAKLAVEIEGGAWTAGRHTRGRGFIEDCRKYSTAIVQGWTLFRFPTQMVLNGEASALLKLWKENNWHD
jgi:very-short-patch-repair endonuclease